MNHGPGLKWIETMIESDTYRELGSKTSLKSGIYYDCYVCFPTVLSMEYSFQSLPESK